jgi:hypothetical protein
MSARGLKPAQTGHGADAATGSRRNVGASAKERERAQLPAMLAASKQRASLHCMSNGTLQTRASLRASPSAINKRVEYRRKMHAQKVSLTPRGQELPQTAYRGALRIHLTASTAIPAPITPPRPALQQIDSK